MLGFGVWGQVEKNIAEVVGNLNPFVFMWEPNENCLFLNFQVVPAHLVFGEALLLQTLKFHVNKSKIKFLHWCDSFCI